MMSEFNLDRCNLSVGDVVITLTIFFILYSLDMFFTFHNMKLLREYKPRAYRKFIREVEYNQVIGFLVERWGLCFKSIFGSMIVSLFFVGVILFVVPFTIVPYIGFLVAVNLLVHIPNYRFLKKKIAKRCGVVRFD